MPPVVETRGLTKIFRDFWMRPRVRAVVDLNLLIKEREVFGMLGPNGSGKSTTIKLLLGLLFPTRGQISILGHAPTDVAAKARIGYLPEETHLYPFLNARETLDFYGRLFHINRRERNRRIDMLLTMVGLEAHQRRPVGEYSKGMQRRIGLAQALINDPDLLILDEPTSGMDPIGTRQIKDLILQLRDRGKTILLSSHLLADVEDICDRITILYGGRERATGTVSELLTDEGTTSIETGRLKPETIDRIKAVIATEESGQEVRISAGRQRLEALFLDIVKRAQDEDVQTSGAAAGGPLAEFLVSDAAADSKNDDGPAVIEDLVAAGKQAAERAAAEKPANAAPEESSIAAEQSAEEKPDAALLEQLAQTAPQRPKTETAAATAEAVESSKETKQDAVDQSVIDDLTGEGKTE